MFDRHDIIGEQDVARVVAKRLGSGKTSGEHTSAQNTPQSVSSDRL
jgi:hypothetical protein